MLLSPAAAVGAIIAAGGHRWAFAAVAALYAVTIVVVAGLPAAVRPAAAHRGLAGELRDGLGRAGRRPGGARGRRSR